MAHFVLALVALAAFLLPSPIPGPAAEVVPALAVTRPKPVGVPGEWRLVWRDEFRGERLNLRKWRPNWLGANDRVVTKPINDLEVAAYDPRQVSVGNGVLRLRAAKRTVTANDGRTYRYVSGMVESFHDFRFTHGFAEARILLRANADRSLAPVGSAGPNWPAFWLNGKNHPEDGEIDVMEVLSDNDVAWHYHWARGSNGGYPSAWRGRMPGGGGWHTFGVRWNARSLTFYYDGIRVGRHARGVTSVPHYLILNLALSEPPYIKVPQTVRVGYVRVWKRA